MSRRAWGYWVWLIGAGALVVPELIAVFDAGALPFTTISQTVGHLERHHNSVELVVVALIVLATVAGASLATAEWWDDGAPHYRVSYVLYGTIGLLWIVVPSALAFCFAADAPFPTFFRTIRDLEDGLASRGRPTLAWLLSYAILAALVILLLHLTLYPFPHRITQLLNPNG